MHTDIINFIWERIFERKFDYSAEKQCTVVAHGLLRFIMKIRESVSWWAWKACVRGYVFSLHVSSPIYLYIFLLRKPRVDLTKKQSKTETKKVTIMRRFLNLPLKKGSVTYTIWAADLCKRFRVGYTVSSRQQDIVIPMQITQEYCILLMKLPT